MSARKPDRRNETSGQPPRMGVVTVTYNSDPYFDTFMQSLAAQTVSPECVVLIDSGSTDAAFLERARHYRVKTEIVQEANIGVCAGNNIGWRRLRHLDYILFLNPDAFLTPRFVEDALQYMDAEPGVGMVTPSLLRYDVKTGKPLDIVDTTGVIRTRRGLLAERDEGKPASVLRRYTRPNEVPWLCTAVALCRREALESVVEEGDQLFDESFFMYKDDTDLSWRVRRAGWKIMHHPALLGYHCRGWQDRASVPRKARLLTARNEIRTCIKNRSPFVVVGILKYIAVKLLNR